MKKGSALLVVLGMLAFMLISAVSFSAYMRYARLPSSFLRRSSASRLLVKAALAEAIDEIDAAIGNNPHPGVGTQPPRRGAGSLSADINGLQNESMQTRNIWQNRVYIGTNQLHEAEDTVSTLTLEGLAYIPPPLVNEARYYSRRSQAGIWKHLGFDSGRYAFCAIDVSDYFDVNTLAAKVARSSSPAGKISLAYLFEDQQHRNYESDPEAWDDFIEKGAQARKISAAEAELKGEAKTADPAYVPFVSVADLNLAIGAQSPVGWQSPFCEYVKNNGSDFYGAVGATDPTGPGADKVNRMTFVADGWFPEPPRLYSTSAGGKINPDIDICDTDNQPFPQSMLDECDTIVIRRLLEYGSAEASSKGAFRLRNHISGLGLTMLYDYLDENNVPASLAIPSVERTPMIAGIKQDFSALQIALAEPETDPKDVEKSLNSVDCPGATPGPDGKTRTVTYKKIYKLDGKAFSAGVDAATFRAVVAYPFHRPGTKDTFKLDGHVELFFTTGDMRLRAEDADVLHVKSDIAPDLPRMISGLQTAEQNFDGNGVFNISLGEHTLTFPDTCPDESAAVIDVDDFEIQKRDCAKAIANVLNDQPLLTVTWEHKQEVMEGPDGKTVGWKTIEAKRTEAYCGIQPLTASGARDARFAAKNNVVGLLESGAEKLTLNAAVCFRIKNEEGKTVDLVPAYMDDDSAHNNLNNFKSMTGEANRMGGAYPLMLFRGNSIDFNDTVFDKREPVQFNAMPNAVYCLDPRWNWAPEHWMQCNDITASDWLNKCHNLFESSGTFSGDTYVRDRDIFLATSDTAYMQSVYELACLPRVTELVDAGSSEIWGNVDRPDDPPGGQPIVTFLEEAAFVTPNFPNRHLMWRTYCPFDRIWNKTGKTVIADEFERVGMVSNGGGYKINPYSPDTNIVMAAFANTPLCWWAACVNPNKQTGIPESERLKVKDFNKNYCFNEIAGTKSENKFAWKDLKRVAQNFVANMHDNSHPEDWVWQESFDWLDWSGSLGHPSNAEDYKDYFGTPSSSSTTSANYDFDQLSNDTCDLYDVDRKFLYGYWRECFAAKQQLFLVFVRAEPMMMGGGSAGQTPPQLGARAVALVWRDPTKSNDEQAPHRTRVLFYRQFD